MGPANIDNLELGARFRAAREVWGLSAARAAAVLGVEPGWLAAVEEGRATINSGELVRLAHGYGRGPEDLFAERFDPVGPLAAFPAAELAAREGVARDELLDRLAVARALTSIERVLGEHSDEGAPLLTVPALTPTAAEPSELRRRLFALCADAYRRGAITRGKLKELGRLAHVPPDELERTVDALADVLEEAVPAEVPANLFSVVGKR